MKANQIKGYVDIVSDDNIVEKWPSIRKPFVVMPALQEFYISDK